MDTIIAHYHTFAWIAIINMAFWTGSLMNVVIYRLPIMVANRTKKSTATYNLAWPPSSCPHCGHQISALENIPVLSWVFLRGKCKSCHRSVSIRYPIVEILIAGVIILTFKIYGLDQWDQGLAAAVLNTLLVSVIFIDSDTDDVPKSLFHFLAGVGLLNLIFHFDFHHLFFSAVVTLLCVVLVPTASDRNKSDRQLRNVNFLCAALTWWLPAAYSAGILIVAVVALGLIEIMNHRSERKLISGVQIIAFVGIVFSWRVACAQ